MKSVNFSFGNDDISAISHALSALPAYEAFDSFPPNLVSMPASIIMKLNRHEHLNNQELYLVAVSVDFAYKALRGEISVEEEAISELRPYLFTINKLQPSLSAILDSE